MRAGQETVTGRKANAPVVGATVRRAPRPEPQVSFGTRFLQGKVHGP